MVMNEMELHSLSPQIKVLNITQLQGKFCNSLSLLTTSALASMFTYVYDLDHISRLDESILS